MQRFDLTALAGQAQRFGVDVEIGRSVPQVQPRIITVRSRAMDGDLVMGPERRHPLAGPTIAEAGWKLVPIENAGDLFIIGNRDELADRRDDVGRCSCRLPWAAWRHAQFSVHPARTVDPQTA